MSEAGGPTRPPGQSGPPERPFSAARAAVLVALAVAIGVYLLSLGGPGAKSLAASHQPRTSSPPASTAPPATTTPTTAAPGGSGGATASGGTAPSSAVHVLVANASQTNGVAAYYSKTLSSAGWGTLTPVTALTSESTSSVYYATGQQGAAQTIAAALGISSVQALAAAAAPVPSTTGADVIVVIGDDLAAKAPAGG